MMTRTVTSLAVLKISWDYLKKDYIESFIPFVATLINKRDYKTIEPFQVCEDFKEEFGLIIPYHPMVTILKRAKLRKLIKRDKGSYIPVKSNIVKYDFTDVSNKQERKQEKVINEFMNFAKDRYNVYLRREEAESALVIFLKRYDLEILFASQEKSVLPDVKPSKRDKFLFGAFIKSTYDSGPEIFEFIVDIAIGHILASALLYGSEFKQFEGGLNKLNLYFDTRFTFRLWGTEGEERKSVYKDFLKNLKNQRATFFLFRHNYDEIMGILENCYDWVESPSYDPSKASIVLKYFVENRFKQTDVQRFIMRVDKLLEEHNIKVVETPAPKEYQSYQIDEKELRKCVIKAYTKFNPNFEEWGKDFTIQKDIESVSAVNKLRTGKAPKNIKKAGHIFVTTNTALAYANRRFEISEKGESFYIPACLTDVFVGTLIWLQSPAQVNVLNRKKILADCYAALQPDNVLIKKFLNEVEKLRDEGKVASDEYYLLRSSIVIRELLTEKTMGDPANFTKKTALEILEEIEGRIKKEGEQRYLEEREKHERTKREFETIKAEKEGIETAIRERAERISDIIGKLLFWVLVILFICGIASQFLVNFSRNRWLRWFSLLVTIFSAGSVIFGVSIKGIKIKGFIRDKIIRWFKR